MSPLKKDKIVVEKAEEEELPPGWKKELKIRKSGSTTKVDKHYTDPVTGYIFHSFKDVQRYLRTGEIGKLASKPKGSDAVDMDNAIEPSGKKSIEVEEMSATWRHKRPLEDGSGGHKTSSKLSETVKSELPHRASKRLAGIDNAPLTSPDPKTRQAVRLTAVKIDAPPSSPSEPKTRQATRQAGIQIDTPPSSPPDTRTSRRVAGVTIDESARSQPEPKTRQATRQAGIKIETPPSSPPDTRTSRQATPLSGASINASAPTPSPPEPKTRQATRQTGIKIDSPPPSLPNSRTHQPTLHSGLKAEASVPSSPEPKTSKVTRLVGIEMVASPPEPKTRQAKQAAGVEIDALYSSLPDSKARKATQKSGTRDDSIPPSLPGSKTCQATGDSGINVNASVPSPPEHKTQKTTRVVGMEIDASPPSLPEPKARKATRRSGIVDDLIPSSPSEPKTRRATRQSGIKIESPPSSQPDMINSRQTTRRVRVAETVKLATPKEIDKKVKVANADMDDKHENSVILPPVSQEKVNKDDFKPNENQESHILLHSSPKEYHRVIVMGPAPLTPVSQITMEQQPSLPTVVHQPNLGIQIDTKHYEKQKSPVVSVPTSNPMPQYGFGGVNPDSSMNFSLNDLWTDPCIEFAVKTLTGAIPFGDLNKVDNFGASSVELPMEELWTDPCIEFAVKTLTGAIPIEKDDYLSRQPASSSKPQALHDYTLPDVGTNFCQTEVLSQHFEMGHNNKQQESVVPILGNGGLQKPGNKFVGQVVNGSNGQCSRSRFFQ